MDKEKFMVSLLEEMSDSELEAFCDALECEIKEEEGKENSDE